jgi:hypothetical protein
MHWTWAECATELPHRRSELDVFEKKEREPAAAGRDRLCFTVSILRSRSVLVRYRWYRRARVFLS